MQWFVNNSQCQSSCRKITFKLFQRDKSFMDSFKGPAPKFCIYFSFSKLPPLCSLSPLGEAEGGAADKNFCLPSDQPTILFFGDGNCFESVCKVILANINHHWLENLFSSDSSKKLVWCSYKHFFAMIFIWVIICKQSCNCSIYFLMCPSIECRNTTFINAF